MYVRGPLHIDVNRLPVGGGGGGRGSWDSLTSLCVQCLNVLRVNVMGLGIGSCVGGVTDVCDILTCII